MPAVMKTPGVYIIEENAFPSSVVEVATAVPAFIGYTERADNKGRSLSNMPWRITSLAEYMAYFGGPAHPVFDLTEPGAGATVDDTPPPTPEATEEGENGEETPPAPEPEPGPTEDVQMVVATDMAGFYFSGRRFNLIQSNGEYLLYKSMALFFQNGGGSCYVLSVGNYSDDIEIARLEAGILTLVKEQEPTMVVIPEAVRLGPNDCISLQQSMLRHCGAQMKNRFAVLDVYNGYRDRQHPDGDVIDNFRSALGVNNLDFGAAYYPWVNTTIVRDADLSFDNITGASLPLLQGLLREELGLPDDASIPEGRAAQQA